MIPLKDDNPTSSRPIVSYGIIGFCILIFIAQLGLSENELRDFTYSYGLIPSVLMGIDQEQKEEPALLKNHLVELR